MLELLIILLFIQKNFISLKVINQSQRNEEDIFGYNKYIINKNSFIDINLTSKINEK